MTPEQIKLLEDTASTVQKIHTELVGDPDYQRPGLIKRVSLVEAWRVQIDLQRAKYVGIVIGAGVITEGLKWAIEAWRAGSH